MELQWNHNMDLNPKARSPQDMGIGKSKENVRIFEYILKITVTLRTDSILILSLFYCF